MSQLNDYGTNSYYSAGGAGGGGGGYLQQGGSPFSASGSPGGVRRSEASHSLRPLTVAQLVKATQAHTDAEWIIEDAEVGQVTLVGQVVSIQSQTTNCVYWLDDGTGRIEARHWVDSSSEEDTSKWGGIEENSYARVTGTLKTFGAKRYINANHIRACKDSNELYFHTLEAITVSVIFERGPPPGPGQAQQQIGATMGGPTGPSAYSTQSHSAGANEEFANLPPMQRSIIKFILEQPPNDEGVHVAAIARAIGGDAHKISDALDKLMDEGHVFSTIDDSHFNVAR